MAQQALVPARRWWRRPWAPPFVMLAVAFVAFSLPPYLSLDPGRSRVPAPDGSLLYYALLVGHVLFGSTALLACGMQVWPWFRRRYPAAHRIIGRVYVFGGVLPAGLLAFAVGSVSPFGPVVAASSLVLAPLWLACTLTGWRMARRRRYAEHRRWMIRSFALTASIITNRLWTAIAIVVLSPRLAAASGAEEQALITSIAGVSAWLGWTLPLLFAEWWLERPAAPGRRTGRASGTPGRDVAEPLGGPDLAGRAAAQ